MTRSFGEDIDNPDIDHALRLRLRWRRLVEDELPGVAAARRWPVRLDHCFARILLDAACGAPWRTVIGAPAWRNAPRAILTTAIALGEACLAGDADLAALNRKSLAMRRAAKSGELAGASRDLFSEEAD